jgi:hypothetical protein
VGSVNSLELNVRYKGQISDVQFGMVPTRTLQRVLGSGRLCGVLLEYEIAERFGLENGTQGASFDLKTSGDRGMKIQCKTFKDIPPNARFTSGRDKGSLKCARADKIWTTKSGYWDRRSKMNAAQHEDAVSYYEQYDWFMFIEIANMHLLEYSFVTVPTKDVLACIQTGPTAPSNRAYCISVQSINAFCSGGTVTLN